MPIITIDPEIAKFTILKPGTYGADGEATLEKVEVKPWSKNNSDLCCEFQVVVVDPDTGDSVRIFQRQGMKAGSRVPRYLAQLGIDHDTQRAGFQFSNDPDPQEGVATFELPMEVIVDVTVETFETKSGETGEANRFENIHARVA